MSPIPPDEEMTPQKFANAVGTALVQEGGKNEDNLILKDPVTGRFLPGHNYSKPKGAKSIRALMKSKMWARKEFVDKVFIRLEQLCLSDNEDVALRAIMGVLNWVEPGKVADINLNPDNRRVIIQTNAQQEELNEGVS